MRRHFGCRPQSPAPGPPRSSRGPDTVRRPFESSTLMTDTHTEILSAFCDGEAVDPDLFAVALADVHARQALVDFARLRAAVTSSQPLPPSLSTLRRMPRWRRIAWTAAATAAAMIVLVALTIALLPRSWTMRDATDRPPSPSRVVRYQPGVDWHPEQR